MSNNSSGQQHDRTALILYGSETGAAQDGAEQIGRITERLRFVTTAVELNAVEINVLSKFTVVIFAISTTGQGEIPANAQRFWKSLLRKRLAPDCLSHVCFSTFGFGDSSYVKFNWAARKLHKRLEQLGAKEIYPRGEADEQHPEGTDGAFLPWSVDLKLHLLKQFPLPESVLPIPDSELLPPQWMVNITEPPSNATTTTTATTPTPTPTRQSSDLTSPSVSPTLLSKQSAAAKMDDPIPKSKLLCIKDSSLGDDIVYEESLPPEDILPVPNSHLLCVDFNRRLTPKSHWQDVRHISFLADDELKYLPGDIITIYPKNFPQDVDNLIELQGWQDIADKPITIRPTAKSYSQKTYIPCVAAMRTVRRPTLRSLLINNLDISAIPRRYFFEVISKFTDDPLHRDRLLELTNPVYSDEFFDYTTRPRRSILEVLQDFPSVRIPWNWAPSIFPELRGRQFSICSGGDLKHAEPHATTLQICVAIVKYQTVLKKTRQGVCSRYLASLRVGNELSVSFTRSPSFHVTTLQLQRPIIMVAPGTGIAPMRSLIWERADRRRNDGLVTGRAILIYGGRNINADFLFKNEWGSRELDVEVFTAFSRDQREKRYVQDVIREQTRLIHEMIVKYEGSIFVCGSSGKMPIAVRAAIADVFHEMETKNDWNYTKEQAEAAVADLEKNGRFKQETW